MGAHFEKLGLQPEGYKLATDSSDNSLDSSLDETHSVRSNQQNIETENNSSRQLRRKKKGVATKNEDSEYDSEGEEAVLDLPVRQPSLKPFARFGTMNSPIKREEVL